MARSIILACVFLFGGAVAIAVPNRIDPKVPVPSAIPDLSGRWNCGTIEQHGKEFRVNGHAEFVGCGQIRKDGSILIWWTLIAGGDMSVGVYWIGNGITLKGLWGDGLDEDGEVCGDTQNDELWEVK